MTETYLGDGVYAEWDGYYVTLSVDDGTTEQTVHIDPDVWESLRRFVEAIPAGGEG